jgi:ABC-type sugar transport system permease subunit
MWRGTVGGEFVFAFLLALLVNHRFRFKNALNSPFFMPWIMPSVVVATTRGGPIDRTTILPILIYRSSFQGSMDMGYSSAVGMFWLLFLLGFSA